MTVQLVEQHSPVTRYKQKKLVEYKKRFISPISDIGLFAHTAKPFLGGFRKERRRPALG
jgi:hypothetical protein